MASKSQVVGTQGTWGGPPYHYRKAVEETLSRSKRRVVVEPPCATKTARVRERKQREKRERERKKRKERERRECVCECVGMALFPLLTHTHTHTHIHTHIHTYTNTFTHIHTHSHTYTHTTVRLVHEGPISLAHAAARHGWLFGGRSATSNKGCEQAASSRRDVSVCRCVVWRTTIAISSTLTLTLPPKHSLAHHAPHSNQTTEQLSKLSKAVLSKRERVCNG